MKVKGHLSKKFKWSHREIWMGDMAPFLQNNDEKLGVRVVGIAFFLP